MRRLSALGSRLSASAAAGTPRRRADVPRAEPFPLAAPAERREPTAASPAPPAPPARPALPRLALLLALAASPAAAQERLLDAFDSTAAWGAAPSDGVSLRLAADSGHRGRALRMDVDFQGGGGYAVARRKLPLELPPNYAITFWVRGDVPPNNLEFKLVDPSGDNVWWVNRRDFKFPAAWTKVTIRKRNVEFAWGPSGGGELKTLGSLEIAVTAGSGGRGRVWLDELAITPLEPVTAYDLTPKAEASSQAAGSAAALALDGDTASAWRSARDGEQQLTVDFGKVREYGGLVLRWDAADHATHYTVATSADGKAWTPAYTVRDGDGGRDFIPLPETEGRWLRLALQKSARGRGYALRHVDVRPLDFAATPNAFAAAVARESPAGSYPRYLYGQQSYWTVLGVPGDDREGLLSDDGMLETGKGAFSLEPFVRVGGRLVGWRDVTRTHALDGGSLPIPTVTWAAPGLAVAVTALAEGSPGQSVLYARYRVENRGTSSQQATLYLALRPFQVNPSSQFLGTPGGTAELRELAYAKGVVAVNRDRAVVSLTRPGGFGASAFDAGNVVDALRQGRLPKAQRLVDSTGRASAALAYPLRLAPGAAAEVYVAVPLHDKAPRPAASVAPAAARALFEARLAAARQLWSERLGRVAITLPAPARRVAESVRSTLAYILINADGAAIQPGSRSYERSWIRDGSLTSAALLRLGHEAEVKRFREWYAPFQYANGKVPCCVDRRGADPVPEHDSHGQLVYLAAEYYRHTGDRAALEQAWPRVVKAVGYIDSLRQQRMTAEYRTPAKQAYFGMVPASISHEGYSAKPMHSYWDDLFVLRGLKDAAEIAGVLGHKAEFARFSTIRNAFRAHLVASYQRAMAERGIDFLPGSVELGDFDATSTTVGVAPGGELGRLPERALRRTFDKYWESFVARRSGAEPWEAYTPYEWRVAGTYVRLGQPERAHALLEWFFEHQRPRGWNHWAEVVFRDPATPKFIGDMPHTWVGSDFVRSVLDFFAYERESDAALVLGAGIPAAWAAADSGVGVARLRTHYGPLTYTMRATGSEVRVRVEGGVRVPPGGVVVRAPFPFAPASATVNGQPAAVTGGEVVVRALPADVVLRR